MPFLIPFLIIAPAIVPFLIIRLLAKRKAPFSTILLYTTPILLISLIVLVTDNEDLVTGKQSGSGLLGIFLISINLLGLIPANFLFLLIKGKISFTWGYWITVFVLNWIVLTSVAYFPRKLDAYPRTKKILLNAFWIGLIVYYGYHSIKYIPTWHSNLIDSFRFLSDWIHGR